MTTLALVGNPNSGKSTLFNALTRSHQRIGNWPGVTVEQKSGWYEFQGERFEVIDLPGLYDIDTSSASSGLDERIVQDYIDEHQADVYVNVVDATSLERGLYLTTQLRERGIPVVVALTMVDVARRRRTEIDIDALSESLGCPVIPVTAKHKRGITEICAIVAEPIQSSIAISLDEDSRYEFVDRVASEAVSRSKTKKSISDYIDRVTLNRVLAFPIFLVVMYLMFFLSINIGSAFIDFFDLIGSVLFVEGPRQLLNAINSPVWLTAFICDGVGGGVQLVGTFIPVIGALFLFLTLLEDSGYMSRIAFILDKPLNKLGLPGKAFVPLIVGFGCNVPSIMGVRTLDNRPDRILTTIMAPFMSCGARLTVYALFAAAFFPANGQNVVFALYLLGILVALGSAWVVRKHLIAHSSESFSYELPNYHLPSIRGLLTHTWHRLTGFVLRAGKAIVIVVIVLNMVGTIGMDGSVGNENRENSVLSAIGRVITPVFHPMGIEEDNWPATVGIFTGIFAKEVVVGTLDTLYTVPEDSDEDVDLVETVKTAVTSVPSNLAEVGSAVTDPLGLRVESTTTAEEAASANQVEINTIMAMRSLFNGQLGAFSYLVFVLLYMPCVATIGVIYKELGAFWAAFSTSWSVVIAYAAAVTCYQVGMLGVQPIQSLITLAITLVLATSAFALLIVWGRRKAPDEDRLIPVAEV